MNLARGYCDFCTRGQQEGEPTPRVARVGHSQICLECARDAVRAFANEYAKPRVDAVAIAKALMMRGGHDPMPLRPPAQIETDPAPEIAGPWRTR